MSEARTDLVPQLSKNEQVTVRYSANLGVIEANKHFAVAKLNKNQCRDRTETELETGKNITVLIISKLVKALWFKSKTIEAASKCMSIDCIESTLAILSKSGDIDLSFAFARVFQLQLDIHAIRDLAQRCLFLGDLQLALHIYKNHLKSYISNDNASPSRPVKRGIIRGNSGPDRKFVSELSESERVDKLGIELALLVCRSRKGKYIPQRDEMLQILGLPTVNIWLQLGVEMEAIGNDGDAIGCYAVSGDATQVLNCNSCIVCV